MSGNFLAIGVLLAWPILSLSAFAVTTFEKACLFTTLGAYLLLPNGFGLKLVEGVPAVDKYSAPAIALTIVFLFRLPKLVERASWKTLDFLLLVFLFSPIITSQLNSDPVFTGGSVVPGVDLYDGLSSVFGQWQLVVPYLVARNCFLTTSKLNLVLSALVFSALIYSIPALLEERLSPFFNYSVYGVMTTSWDTDYRYGFFRASVFLGHGLVLAFFYATAVIAAITISKCNMRSGVAKSIYLVCVLISTRSVGAVLLGVLGIAIMKFCRPLIVVRISVVIGSLCVAYPLLRTTQILPVSQVLSTVNSVDADRSQSLGFRFDQEDALLARALERKWFGWGRFARSHVYSETGRDLSVTDGLWIITFGQFGLVGFLALFALLVLPMWRAMRTVNLSDQEGAVILAGATLILAVTLADQMTNASLSPWSMLLAGAVAGRVQAFASHLDMASTVQPPKYLFTRDEMTTRTIA